MNFWIWLSTHVQEQFSTFQLDEILLAFVRRQYWVSILLILVVLVVAAVYLATIVGDATRQMRKAWPHLTAWYVFVPSIFGVAGLLVASVLIVNVLRASDLPIPSLSNIAPVFGEDEVLHWALPLDQRDRDFMFEVQSSENPAFPIGGGTTLESVRDTVHPLFAYKNKTLYWRVRAIEVDPVTSQARRYGAWSPPVRIPQYATVLEKIFRTRQLNIAMENQFGRSKFRWFETPEPADPGESRWRALDYRGVEIDIAYAIADEICQRSLDRVQQTKKAVCVPSRAGDEQDAAFERCAKQPDTHCIKIDVHFASIPWSEVMKSVGQGKFDMAISNITYKPEREDEFGILFGTESYESTGHAFVSRPAKSGTPEIGPVVRDPETMLKGKAVAVQDKTTSADCLHSLQESLAAAAGDGKTWSFKVVRRTRSVLAVTMLLRNKANFDFVVTDASIAEGWKYLRGSKLTLIHAAPDFFGKDAPQFCRNQDYRIALKAAEYDLQQLTDTVLRKLKASGDLQRIKDDAAANFASFVHQQERARSMLTAEQKTGTSQ
jgi:ABC-type amino acid transport substrate-binding protein